MLHLSRLFFVGLLTAIAAVAATAEPISRDKIRPAFRFMETEYFHRWSKGDQHEFTPANQEDLKAWTDMVTINVYRQVATSNQLAAVAESVVENYARAGALISGRKSVPPTDEHSAEYGTVAIFIAGEFVEVVFVRLKIVDGVGCGCIFSHRIYGADAKDLVTVWLQINGQKTEQALMQWEDIPSPTALSTAVRRNTNLRSVKRR